MQAQAERPLTKRVGPRLRPSSSGTDAVNGAVASSGRTAHKPSSASVPQGRAAFPPEALEKRTSSWPLTVLTPGNLRQASTAYPSAI
jgi:hypothetical protein